MFDSSARTAATQPRLIKKGCQRCGGDFFFQSDQYGDYFGCLQCGAYVEVRLWGPAFIEKRRGRRPVEATSI